MKYYRVVAKTPYCGEEGELLLAVPDDKTLKDYDDMISELIDETAAEWWCQESAEDFDGDYAEYLGACTVRIDDITEEEFYEEGGVDAW